MSVEYYQNKIRIENDRSFKEAVSELTEIVNKEYERLLAEPRFMLHSFCGDNLVTVAVDSNSFLFNNKLIEFTIIMITCEFLDILEQLKKVIGTLMIVNKDYYPIQYIRKHA